MLFIFEKPKRRNRIYIASPQTVTPTYGAELVIDGGLENWLSATNLTNWTESIAGTSTINRDATYIYGGTYAARLDVDASNSDTLIYQTIASLNTNNFYVMSIWGRSVSGAPTFQMGPVGNYTLKNIALNTTYTQYSGAVMGKNTTFIVGRGTGSNSLSICLDDISVKQITKSSMLGDVRTAASSGTFTTAWPTSPTNGHRVGLIICLDSASNPQNFIMASLDGTNAYLAKWVGGTYTNLISSASAFTAGNLLQIVKDGNSVQLWHKGAQILTTQTISDAGVTGNTKFCWFTTNGALKPTYAQWAR